MRIHRSKTSLAPAKAKEDPKRIVFYGKEYGLLPYHVAALLKKEAPEKEILLIDNSSMQDLYRPLPGTEDIKSAENGYVLSRRLYDESFCKNFDYTIAYLGTYYSEEYLLNADHICLCLGYFPWEQDFMNEKSVIHHTEGQTVIGIFLDKVSGKISEKNILKNTPLQKGDHIYVSELDPADKACYLAYAYNGSQELSKMGNRWKELIVGLCSDITGKPLADFKKAAKEGGK